MTTALVFSGCQQAPKQAPEQMLKDSMKNLTSVTSGQYEFAVNANLDGPQGQDPKKVKVDVTLAGSADIKDLQDPKFNLKFDASGNADATTAAAAAEIRLNKENLFFTLSKLEQKGGGDFAKDFVDTYVGKWWKIAVPPEALKEVAAALPAGGQQSLTPEQQKMKELFESTQFFKDIKYVGAENVKNVPSYHYTVALDKDALTTFVVKATELQGKTLTDSDKADMQKGMKEFDFTGDAWVTQEGSVLHQISGNLKLTPSETTSPSGTIAVRATLWDLNKAVTVEAPANAQDFPAEALLNAVMGGGAPTGELTGGEDVLSTDTTGELIPEGSSSLQFGE